MFNRFMPCAAATLLLLLLSALMTGCRSSKTYNTNAADMSAAEPYASSNASANTATNTAANTAANTAGSASSSPRPRVNRDSNSGSPVTTNSRARATPRANRRR